MRHRIAWLSLFASSLIGCGGNNAPSSAVPDVVGSASLSSLEIEGGALDQVFQPELTEYTTDVRFLVGSTRVKAISENPGASIRINGVLASTNGDTISLAPGSNTIQIDVDAENLMPTLYTITIARDSEGQFAQTTYTKASNPEDSDYFARSANTTVALSGDTLAVGAPLEDSAATGINSDQFDNSAAASGAVYIFVRDPAGTWTQQAYIKASNTGTREEVPSLSDLFGASVALSDNTLVVGAPGEDSASKGLDGNETNNSALDSGAAYVFERDAAGTWSQQAYIKASNTESRDRFGISVALAGGTLVVGAAEEDGGSTGINGDQDSNDHIDSGAVYVFARDSAKEWSQQAYIKASNTNSYDYFGRSVSLSNDTLAVGAVFSNDASGTVYVYARNAVGTWTQQSLLRASVPEFLDQFGDSVALAGDTLAVSVFDDSGATGVDGDENDNTVEDAGAVHVFVRDSAGDWVQQAYLKPSNTQAFDGFGASIALNGDVLAVASTGEDSVATGIGGDDGDNSLSNAGSVFIFVRDAATGWSQQAYIKASNSESEDRFGSAVALSGDTLVIGAFLEDSSAGGIEGDQADNAATDSGAVYVFQ